MNSKQNNINNNGTEEYNKHLFRMVEMIRVANEPEPEHDIFDDIYDYLVEKEDGLHCIEGNVDVSLIIPNNPCGELPWTIVAQLEALGMERKNGSDGQALDGENILLEMTKSCTQEDSLLVQAYDFPFQLLVQEDDFSSHCGVIEYAMVLKNGNYGVDVKYTPKENIENIN